jgi:GIY-YIG catalytic domain
VDPATRKVVYVGHSKNVDARLRAHWKHRRHSCRNRENPAFYGWLQSLLICPGYVIFAEVPWLERFAAERRWTVMLAAKHPLYNISFGAAPLRRPWMTERNRHRGGLTSGAAAA